MKRVTWAACALPCGSLMSVRLRRATSPPTSVIQISPFVACSRRFVRSTWKRFAVT